VPLVVVATACLAVAGFLFQKAPLSRSDLEADTGTTLPAGAEIVESWWRPYWPSLDVYARIKTDAPAASVLHDHYRVNPVCNESKISDEFDLQRLGLTLTTCYIAYVRKVEFTAIAATDATGQHWLLVRGH